MANKKITDLTANTNPSASALYEVDDAGVSGKVLATNLLATDITYAALVTAIGASTLVPNRFYRITDYATVHYIVDSAGTRYSDIITGPTEPLIVQANSSNTIGSVARSALHPEDVIHYDWNPVNWTDDLSFADAEATHSIVAGFKGVITFRHDTLFDNYMGYDFRYCKFRRWKTSVVAWSAVTAYIVGDYATFGGKVWKTSKSGTNHQPDTSPTFWFALIDLSASLYWLPYPSDFNGIPADAASHADFTTFVNNGAGTYASGQVVANHIRGFKDRFSAGYANKTILANNVFFLSNLDSSYIQFFANSIESNAVGNTIGTAFTLNTIGAGFGNNVISEHFYKNTIGSSFNTNLLGTYFNGNTIGSDFGYNIVGSGFDNNTIGVGFSGNTLSSGFSSNIVSGAMSGNTIAETFVSNTIGSIFYGNTISANFQLNIVSNDFNKQYTASVDFLAAAHVYATYNCELFVRQDGTQRLRYTDNSDALVVVAANA